MVHAIYSQGGRLTGSSTHERPPESLCLSVCLSVCIICVSCYLWWVTHKDVYYQIQLQSTYLSISEKNSFTLLVILFKLLWLLIKLPHTLISLVLNFLRQAQSEAQPHPTAPPWGWGEADFWKENQEAFQKRNVDHVQFVKIPAIIDRKLESSSFKVSVR